MSGLVVSYVSQNTDHLRGSLTEFARTQGLDVIGSRTILRAWMFHGSSLRRTWQITAAARRKRCCWPQACTQAHLYVWDEPLNFIDVISRMQVEDLLLACRPTRCSWSTTPASATRGSCAERIRIQRE